MTCADPQGQNILLGRPPRINSVSPHGYRRTRWPGFRPCGRLGRAFLDRLCLSVPEGTCMDLGSDGAGEKTEIRSDVRQNDVRLKNPIRGRVLCLKRTGASPSCLKSVSQILSSNLPFGSCLERRETAAFRRARERLSSSDVDDHSKIPLICKAISDNKVNRKRPPTLIAFAETPLETHARRASPHVPGRDSWGMTAMRTRAARRAHLT